MNDLQTAASGSSAVTRKGHPMGAGVWICLDMEAFNCGTVNHFANITTGKIVHFSFLMNEAFPPTLKA